MALEGFTPEDLKLGSKPPADAAEDTGLDAPDDPDDDDGDDDDENDEAAPSKGKQKGGFKSRRKGKQESEEDEDEQFLSGLDSDEQHENTRRLARITKAERLERKALNKRIDKLTGDLERAHAVAVNVEHNKSFERFLEELGEEHEASFGEGHTFDIGKSKAKADVAFFANRERLWNTAEALRLAHPNKQDRDIYAMAARAEFGIDMPGKVRLGATTAPSDNRLETKKPSADKIYRANLRAVDKFLSETA